jgi:TDG/mug DNA glycosylase family protein
MHAAPVSTDRRHVLPDVLEEGLRIVFCGTAAGAVAARVGAPYAGPGNRFWSILHETGLTPRLLRAQEFRDLSRYGIGLTDVAKFASGSDKSLAPCDFDPAAVVAKMQRYAPGILALVGKRAAREVLGRSVDYGSQDVRVGISDVWVVPSTSGAARGAWDTKPWQELAVTVAVTAA